MKVMKKLSESVTIKVGDKDLLANGVAYGINSAQTLYGFFEQLYHRDWTIDATVSMRVDGEDSFLTFTGNLLVIPVPAGSIGKELIFNSYGKGGTLTVNLNDVNKVVLNPSRSEVSLLTKKKVIIKIQF
ncbi:MAG: hypothetical protein EOM67_07830 [Spirochaetia bacterium]|jgi:hypothetical protein|nr:hypothetical protein [Spirochaetia bacterium]